MDRTIFTAIEHSKTADEVVHQIESLILQGILRVGDRLPGERDLAREMDVSRPVLRTALKSLESRQLLISRQGEGTFVADIIGQVFSQPVLDLIGRHRSATYDYLEYRREIEGIVAALAAERATPTDLAVLRDIVEGMKTAHQAGDIEKETALDVAFHSTIGECAHNTIMLHTLRSCYRLLSDGVFFNRALVYAHSGSRDELLQQHIAIFDSIESGNADAAKKAAENHMVYVMETLQAAERSEDWARVSELRQRQREGAANGRTR